MTDQQVTIILYIVGHLFIVVSAGVAVYTKITAKLKELEVRIQMMEKQESRVLEKLDDITEQISDLKSAIQNKQDRQ